MAKILVADDNSNIQKMVGLALKDQGIDVVAVGNGEAAVRKISDVRPDLVLADVFMPVRNGYEVCKYVKDDAALAHIPVILLVGAFDPLDEQEAQRVGADGVLKKPFVPPDPLISMVKSALARVGVPASGAATGSAATGAASGSVKPDKAANIPVLSALPKESQSVSLEKDNPAFSAPTDMASTLPPLKLPPATSIPQEPEQEEQEDEAAIVSTTEGAHFGAERDWRSVADEEDGEEEAAPAKSSWRRDAGDEESFVEEVPAAKASDWRESLVEPPAGLGSASEDWTPTREKQDLVDLPDRPEVEAGVGSGTSSTARLAGVAAPFAGDAWAAAMGAGPEEKPPKEVVADPDETIIESAATSFRAMETSVAAEASESSDAGPAANLLESSLTLEASKSAEAEKPAESWFSNAPSPWESEARKATQLAATWGNPGTAEPVKETVEISSNGAASMEAAEAAVFETSASTEAAESAPPVSAEGSGWDEVPGLGEASGSAYSGDLEILSAQGAQETEREPSAYGETGLDAEDRGAATETKTEMEVGMADSAEGPAISAAAVETIREEVAEIVEEPADATVSEPSVSGAKIPIAAPALSDMDAIVAKVLANLSPEVLQAVTREILKPVVEAIVRDELKQKKSE